MKKYINLINDYFDINYMRKNMVVEYISPIFDGIIYYLYNSFYWYLWSYYCPKKDCIS